MLVSGRVSPDGDLGIRIAMNDFVVNLNQVWVSKSVHRNLNMILSILIGAQHQDTQNT